MGEFVANGEDGEYSEDGADSAEVRESVDLMFNWLLVRLRAGGVNVDIGLLPALRIGHDPEAQGDYYDTRRAALCDDLVDEPTDEEIARLVDEVAQEIGVEAEIAIEIVNNYRAAGHLAAMLTVGQLRHQAGTWDLSRDKQDFQSYYLSKGLTGCWQELIDEALPGEPLNLPEAWTPDKEQSYRRVWALLQTEIERCFPSPPPAGGAPGIG